MPVNGQKVELFLGIFSDSQTPAPSLKIILSAELGAVCLHVFLSISPSPFSLLLHEFEGHSGVNESIVPEGEGWLCGEDYLLVLSCGIQFLLEYEPVSELHH